MAKEKITINRLRSRAAEHGLGFPLTASKADLAKLLVDAGIGTSDVPRRKEQIKLGIESSMQAVKSYKGHPLFLVDIGSYQTRVSVVNKGSIESFRFRSIVGEAGKTVCGDDAIEHAHNLRDIKTIGKDWDYGIANRLVLHGAEKVGKKLRGEEVRMVLLAGGNDSYKQMMEEWGRQLRGYLHWETRDVIVLDWAHASAYGVNQSECSLHIEGGHSKTGLAVVTGRGDFVFTYAPFGGREQTMVLQELLPEIPWYLLDDVKRAVLLEEKSDDIWGMPKDKPAERLHPHGIYVENGEVIIGQGKRAKTVEVAEALEESYKTQAKHFSYYVRDLIDKLPYNLQNTVVENIYTGGDSLFPGRIRDMISDELEDREEEIGSIYHINDSGKAFRGAVYMLGI